MDREVDSRLTKIVAANWANDPISAHLVDATAPRIDKRAVIAELLKASRPDLVNAFVNMTAAKLDEGERDEMEKFVWAKTPKDYRSMYQGKRSVMYMGKSGAATLSPLDTLSDAELSRLAKMKGWRGTAVALVVAATAADTSVPTFVIARPGVAQAAGQFDYEGKDVGVVIHDRPPNLQVDVFSPLANVGKRGQTVDKVTYQLWYSPYSKSRTAWGATLKSKLKAKKGASVGEVLQLVRSLLQEAERESINLHDEHPAKFYEPFKQKLKGMDASIPDPSTVLPYEDKKGIDITVKFQKPSIVIYSKQDSDSASQSRMERYITVNWAFAKKVSQIADELVKGIGLRGVEQLLEKYKIRYKSHSYMDPMWA